MSSTIKVDNIQDQDGNNIINESSNTITVGASGDTIIIPSGATITNNGTQTGFGRTGTVDWQTGSIKTATFTAANGEGYFCNTTSGGFTVNLPAGSAGAIVSLQDYNNTFDSNSLLVTPNGSEKINGGAGSVTLSTEGEGITLVYIDSTVGWRSIQDNVFADVGSNFINATGGTETECGNFKIHTFTGPGTFTVSAAAACAANNTVGYLVLAGGGGATLGGGGAGGYREGRNAPVDNFTASPLVANAPTNAITVTATAYPITVGSGGAKNTQGSTSTFSTISSAGGGRGGDYNSTGGTGGSGGGAGRDTASGGTGNSPPTSPAQGQNGGASVSSGPSCWTGAGGGGGAGAVGSNGTGNGSPPNEQGGAGGNGVASSITGSSVTRAGGGGGTTQGPNTVPGGAGGSGGGGAAGRGTVPYCAAYAAGTAGTANTGGGGGGGGTPGSSAGAGGSGIVIIRYKFQ